LASANVTARDSVDRAHRVARSNWSIAINSPLEGD
jgi:hypothetical protein